MNDPPTVRQWIPLVRVPEIVENETGYRPTRQTVYNWVQRGWLQVGVFKPLRTTRKWIYEFLATRQIKGVG